MEVSLYPSVILVWVMSLLLVDVQAQVGTASTLAMVTELPEERVVSPESSPDTTLADATSIHTSTNDGSLVTTPAITIASIISTTTISPTQAGDIGERADVNEEGIEYPDTTPVPDVIVITTTPTTVAPVAPSSTASPATAAVSPTVAPLPIPEVTTTSPPEMIQTSASPVVTTAGVSSSQPTTPGAIEVTSPPTERPKTRITSEIIPVDNEVETDVNGTTLLMVMSTTQPEENETTNSSSEFDLDSNTTIQIEDEVSSTSITFTTDDRSAIDSLVQAACEKEQRIDTVVILGVVVIVNVISVVVTALCVYRVVKRHLSWDPPPFAFPKGGHGEEPLDNRCGRNLASDADCKSGEGGTNIPIIITNEDGWCVPYTENDIKKTRNKVEDTGV